MRLMFDEINKIHTNLHHRGLFTKVPYRLNDIIEAFETTSPADEINIHTFSNPDSAFWGQLRLNERHTAPYAPTQTTADIYVSEDLPSQWQRYVVAKELCQILWMHRNDACCNDPEKMETLIRGLAMPDKLKEIMPMPDVTERACWLGAFEVFIPLQFRSPLVSRLAAEQISVDDVSKDFGVPKRIVKAYMTPEMHELIAGPFRTMKVA